MKDYYKILEIPQSATQEEIKQAYRKAVIYWHPDVNKSPEAHERIIEINAAYEVLGNEGKRSYYDQLLNYQYQPQEPQAPYTTYTPNRNPYPKREQRFKRQKFPVYLIFLLAFSLFRIISIFNDNSSDRAYEFESKDIFYREILYPFSTDSLGKKINLDNFSIDTAKKISGPFIAYKYSLNRLIIDNFLCSELNPDIPNPVRIEDINTIVICRHQVSNIDTSKIKKQFPVIEAVVFYADPEDLTVYNCDTIFQPTFNSSSKVIAHEILKQMKK